MCYLIGVSVCIGSQELGIYRSAVVQFKHPLFTKYLCGFIDRMIIKTEQNFTEFAVGQLCHAFCINECFLVYLAELHTKISKHIVIVCHINI